MNAVTKEEQAALTRCTATAQAMLTNGPRPESLTEHDALIDAGFDELDPTDEEITAMGTEYGLTLGEWVIRLSKYVESARAGLAAA